MPDAAPEYDNPDGVPIAAILFGGRRKTTMPLVYESRDWQHGTFIGATLSSETTAAATGAVGVVRRDPMAMLPFIGYHAGDYVGHWLEIGKGADTSKLPRIFGVNWFRRDEDGSFLWPGFGDNSRVLKWVVERLEGEADAVETPIGLVPTRRRASTSTGSTCGRDGSRRRSPSTSTSGSRRCPSSRSGSRGSVTELPAELARRAGRPEGRASTRAEAEWSSPPPAARDDVIEEEGAAGVACDTSCPFDVRRRRRDLNPRGVYPQPA